MTTSVFSVVNAVLLRPLPYRDAWDRLAVISSEFLPGTGGTRSPSIDFEDWRRDSKTLKSAAVYQTFFHPVLTGAGTVDRLSCLLVSHGYFDVMKVRPEIGRFFTPEEDRDGRDDVVVLSHDFWRSRFQSDPNVIGSSIWLDQRPHTIVGVSGFRTCYRFLGSLKLRLLQIYRPIGEATGTGVARRPPPVSAGPPAARGFRARGASGSRRALPADAAGPRSRRASRGRHPRSARAYGAGRPCSPVVAAGRSTASDAYGLRQYRQLAAGESEWQTTRDGHPRSSSGAGAARLVRMLLAESLVLRRAGRARWRPAGSGKRGRLTVSPFAARLARRWSGGVRRTAWSAFAQGTVGWCRCPGFVHGAGLPASASPELRRHCSWCSGGESLAITATWRPAGYRPRSRWPLANSYWRDRDRTARQEPSSTARTNLGFDRRVRRRLLQERFRPGNSIEPRWTALAACRQHILDQFERAIPRRVPTAAVNVVPMSGDFDRTGFAIYGRPARTDDRISPDRYIVSPDYFRTVRIPLRQGRLFTNRDDSGHPPACVINEICRARVCFGESPLGKKIRAGGISNFDDSPFREVVGVVGDVAQYGLGLTPTPQIYIPHGQFATHNLTLMVRTDGDPAAIAGAVRTAVSGADREPPIYGVVALAEIVANTMAARRLGLWLVAGIWARGSAARGCGNLRGDVLLHDVPDVRVWGPNGPGRAFGGRDAPCPRGLATHDGSRIGVGPRGIVSGFEVDFGLSLPSDCHRRRHVCRRHPVPCRRGADVLLFARPSRRRSRSGNGT